MKPLGGKVMEPGHLSFLHKVCGVILEETGFLGDKDVEWHNQYVHGIR
jgi:hypothetical protein